VAGNTNRGQIDPGSNIGISPITDDIGTSSINWGGKSPIEYIQYLMGDSVFDLFGDKMLNDAFERAFIETSGLILDDIILENLNGSNSFSSTSQSAYGAAGFTDNYPKRILKVVRQNTTDEDSDGTDQYYYDARKIQNIDSEAINPNSIYYENDPFNPAWYIATDAGINIIPKNSSSHPTGKVYYMSYPKFGVGAEIDSNQTHDLGEKSGNQNFSLISSNNENEIFYGIPLEARQLIYLSTALNLVEGYLSNHIQDDEDIELVQLLKAQYEMLVNLKSKEVVVVQAKFGEGNPIQEMQK
tara:strand:- start:207 stop:1103 length:897 start_codon:yes stop_codon:yes gene_type:complete